MLKNQIRKSLVEQGLALSNKAVQENNKKIQKRVIDNFELSLKKTCSKKRIYNIYQYKKLIENGVDLGPPLYIAGCSLKFLGAKTKANELFMLDGSRRLIATALCKKDSTKIYLMDIKL